MATIRNAALGGMALLGLGIGMMPGAKAAFVATMVPSGSDVVVTGSGSIDLTDLTHYGNGLLIAGLIPTNTFPGAGGLSAIGIGSSSTDSVLTYTGISWPGPYGSGGFTAATSGSGDKIVLELGFIAVPDTYVSGAPLSDTSTYAGATFASLGVTPGTYVWTWGSGPDADSFTLNITDHVAPVPEPASLALFATGLIGLTLKRRRAA